MKNKIMYVVILVFSISLIASAKKISGCNATGRPGTTKEKLVQKNAGKESGQEPATLSLFFFNI